MTEHTASSSAITAIWHANGQCFSASRPVATLQARNATELAALPQRISALLKPGQQAVGVIGYEAGTVVYVFDEGDICRSSNPAAMDVSDQNQSQNQNQSRQDCRSYSFTSNMSAAEYAAAFNRIQDYLRAGDCYQVNFARRFSAPFSGDPLLAWQRLVANHPAPHSSFFRLPNGDCVFGVSPERLLRIHQYQNQSLVMTEPIKGSRPRGSNAEQDQALADALLNSDKDRAENLMIVDLLRNDLGKVCVAGSVKAEPLFELRKFSNVQHLVSTISGTLRPDISPLAALLSCFPGGSITGAPKKRAMEIIAELEPVPRGFYCGTQFSLDADGNLESNILIRTFQTQGDTIVCHGGGGIVIDSELEQEYQESLFKIERLMAAL